MMKIRMLALVAVLVLGGNCLAANAADESRPGIELRVESGPRPAIGGTSETYEFRMHAKAPTDGKVADWSWHVSRAELRFSQQNRPELERLASEKWDFEPAHSEALLRVQFPKAGYWRLIVRATPRESDKPELPEEQRNEAVEIVLPEVTVASVRMATSGTLRVVQSARDCEATVVAVVSPPEVGIRWFLKDPIYRRPYFSYSGLGRPDGYHAATIRLDKSQPGWGHWTEDSVITVTATAVGTTCEASCEVETRKFRRGGRTAPGSSDVLVPVPFAGSGLIRQHIVREHKQMRGFTAQAASDRLWNTVPQTGSTIPNAGAYGDWQIHYRALDDVGHSQWHIDSAPTFSGRIEVSGKLADPRIRSLSSVDAAGAVWAAFDGAEVRLNDGALGRGVSAERHSLAMSLPRNASSVSIALAEGAAFEASVGPEGRGIMRAEGIHAPQTELWVQRHLHVAASAHVLQLPDPDWTLHAGASLSVEVPKVVWIRFAPDF